MASILLALGATQEDVEALPRFANSLEVDPTLPFRRSRNGRFEIDFAARRISRSAVKQFVLSEDEDFVRHDSGAVREFGEIELAYQENSAFQALLLFKALMIDEVDVQHRPGLDYSRPQSVCTAFLLRTITSAEELGEPALEGVHSDGVDHTMTTLIGAENMTPDSAKTYVIDPSETAGKRWNEIEPEYQLGVYQHVDYLDTLLFADHERKHGVSPVFAADGSNIATRDMSILFTRRPALPEHVSFSYDGLEHHVERPMHIDLPQSGWAQR
ncbi:hypothetical protein C5C00_01630 [Rathayibacter rathayi]|uniref:2OG-Fe dioxygenase family protein n=1 Tax=Rathayibacter rathayi TaxID=33887 RepID=UPI000CE7F6AA|nr:2OG-Fe dioxygenase family protein [Rathayibacter rathayi]PPG90784.1 hypothetical protein C5C47_00905 [Rathayibacter rathayi]PPG98889.1 hypothetical protein C5C00_01630 [Rathayibacter rathayi]